MNFVELDKEQFRSFLDHHPLQTFFQDPNMESIGELEHWHTIYVGVENNGHLVAGTRLVYKTTRFHQKLFYAPRGLLVDYHDKEVLTFFVTSLKKYIKKKGGYTLHIDPPLIYKERDINGDLVLSGVDNQEVVDTLKRLGFHHDGFIRHYDPSKQMRWSFELPLEGKTESDILREMSGNTRRSIQKAEHLKVNVRELTKEELPLFKEITSTTSERRSFLDKSLLYYQTMYDAFHDKNQVRYMVAEVDLDDAILVLQDDIQKLEQTKERASSHHKESLLKETNEQLCYLYKKIEEFETIKAEKGKHLVLTASMFMIYGHDILYYHSGGYKEYMFFFGQYLIQWTMIKEAIKLQKDCYNFYGLKGVFEKNDPDYGVYLFKKGFGGHVIEYIGDFYLPISFYYYVQQFIHKLKLFLSKFKQIKK